MVSYHLGVAISPNIMINFIAETAKKVQANVMAVFTQPSMPSFPGSQYMSNMFDMSKITSGGAVSSDGLAKLQSADMATVADTLK